jgi:hypothetical protein
MIGVFAITTIFWVVTFTYAPAGAQIPVRAPHAAVLAARSVAATNLGNSVTDATTLARSVPGFFIPTRNVESSVAKTEQNTTGGVAATTPAVMTQP